MTKFKNVKVNNASGFSLVELMVVVAIIGILASVAVPQFQKFTFKARMTEAKAGLTSLFTAEKAFYGEWSEFDTRYGVIGYAPEGNYSFNIGFTAAVVRSGNYQTANGLAAAANPLNINANTNVVDFCNLPANAGRCKPLSTTVAAVSTTGVNTAIGWAATTPATCTVANIAGTPSSFRACASASAAINPENRAVNLAINQAKDLRSSEP